MNHRVAAYRYRGGPEYRRADCDTAYDAPNVTLYSLRQPAADLFTIAGYDQKSLRAILLTRAHWDHVSGLPNFPGVPV